MRHPFALSLAGATVALAVAIAATRGARADAPPGSPDFAGVCARARAGVVHVVNYLERPRDVPDPSDWKSSDDNVGSGFVWGSDGWIVTNYHVTQGARQILVHLDGRGWMEARLRGADKVVDVALLKVEATGLVPLPIGDARSLKVGQWVLAAGSPNGLARSFSHGIVSGLERSDTGANPGGYEDYVQTDASVNLGGSGGPLLDAEGRVVGLNTAILSRTGGFQGISLAVPIDVVVQAAEALRDRGAVPRASLGVRLRGASPLVAARLPGGAGLEVTGFCEESPGKRAGLRPGDVITALDGVATPTRGSLQRLVWSRGRGARVTLRFWRGGQEFEAAAVLDEG